MQALLFICLACTAEETRFSNPSGSSPAPVPAQSPNPNQPKTPPPNQICVVALQKDGTAQFIVDGVQCSERKHPVVMLIMHKEDKNEITLCSGTFITTRDILTAAHCLFEPPYSKIDVVYSGQIYKTDQYSLHPLYLGDVPDVHDLGVVTIKTDVAVTPVPLIATRTAGIGESIRILGYGLSEGDLDSPETRRELMDLRAGQMTVSRVNDSDFYAKVKDDSQVTCRGDSGGPALGQEQDQWGILGVTSFGDVNCEFVSAFISVQSEENLSYLLTAAPELETF